MTITNYNYLGFTENGKIKSVVHVKIYFGKIVYDLILYLDDKSLKDLKKILGA
jgi:hypothetical protein